MTLVYERPGAGPRTHAFILGCGRFPHLPAGAARHATVAGARAVVEFLVEHADDLIAPLGTIECLLSDPANAAGADKLPQTSQDPRGDDLVDAVTYGKVDAAGADWLERCQAGDHLFFYIASHGVADRDLSASALFEDVRARKWNRWAQSLNVNVLAQYLPATGAAGCWVFLDACQEIVPEILGQTDGASGLILIKATPQQMATTTVRSFALVGSRFGQAGWAPSGAQPPFFTQALLKSFEACVEPRVGGGWTVTAQQLMFNIPKVAEAALGYEQLEIGALNPFAQAAHLLRVDAPKIPVVVRTQNRDDMLRATQIEAVDDQGASILGELRDKNCFLSVPPSGRPFTTTATFADTTTYAPAVFQAQACAQIVELCP